MIMVIIYQVFSVQNLFAASTWSFTNLPSRGSHPEMLQYENSKIIIDISPLKHSPDIYRAIFVPNRQGNTFNYQWKEGEKETVMIEPLHQPGQYLPLAPPEYLSLDATAAVRGGLAGGEDAVVLDVKNFPFLGDTGKARYTDQASENVVLRLDVTTDQPPHTSIQQVSQIRVRHDSGGTMITWKDPAPIASGNDITFEEFQALDKQDENPREIRYRIYRHTEPITASTIGRAEFIGQTDALSVWNWQYSAHGHKTRKHAKNDYVPRFPLDHGVMTEYDMGLFVYQVPRKTEKAYYAVSRTIDGAEDFSRLSVGENTTGKGISEDTGPGMVLLQEHYEKKKWYFVNGITTLSYFVKWEAPPRFNVPEPFNYLVAVPENVDDNPPVSIALHAWGGSINGGWLYAYNLEKYGAIHVSTNQHPYDWWTGFHENIGTLKPLTNAAGAVEPFTQRRIRSFVDDYVIPNWKADTERILLHGSSMGGSGASLWGIKNGNYFSNLTSKVGVHIPALSPTFLSSFEQVYGVVDQQLKYQDTGMSAWDYQDNAQWLKNNVQTNTPHISFCNGRNDTKIGWDQAWDFVQALIETRRPFTFSWGMKGHAERPYHMGNDIDFQLHQSVPAFSGGSLDDDIGATPETGDSEGQINYHYLWETDSVIDRPDRWEMTIYLRGQAPLDTAEVNLTPRRLQQFKPAAGNSYAWTNTWKGTVVQKGTAKADEYGLITLDSVKIYKDRSCITITPASGDPDTENDVLPDMTDGENIQNVLKTVLAAENPMTVTVSNAYELYGALDELVSYTTIALEDGIYTVDRELRIGPAGGTPLKGVTIKGKSGNRDAVILQGNGMENSAGPNILLKIRNAVNCKIQDMTLRDIHYHLIQVKGEQGAQSPLLKNLHLIDSGLQFVKVTHADNGVIENSTFEFTDHAKFWGKKIGGTYYYTKAVDILWDADNWRISNNFFKKIRAPRKNPDFPYGITKAAIEVWRGCKDTVVEKNVFIDCDRGIFFGNMSGNKTDHIGGIIKNNVIYRQPGQPGDTGIALNKTSGVKVFHNTIILNNTFGWHIEYRRYKNGQNEEPDMIINNLTDGPIRKRDYGNALVENNLTNAGLDWFCDPFQGDLHLTAAAYAAIDSAVKLKETDDDLDGDARPAGSAPDVGSDEFTKDEDSPNGC